MSEFWDVEPDFDPNSVVVSMHRYQPNITAACCEWAFCRAHWGVALFLLAFAGWADRSASAACGDYVFSGQDVLAGDDLHLPVPFPAGWAGARCCVWLRAAEDLAPQSHRALVGNIVVPSLPDYWVAIIRPPCFSRILGATS